MWCYINLICVSLHFEGTYCFLLQGMSSPRWPDTGDRWRYIGLLASKEHHTSEGEGGAYSGWWLELLEPSTHLLPRSGPFQGPYNLHNLFPMSVTSLCLAFGHISITALFGVPKYTTGTTHCSLLSATGPLYTYIPTCFSHLIFFLDPWTLAEEGITFLQNTGNCWPSHISVTSHETGICHTTTEEASNLAW